MSTSLDRFAKWLAPPSAEPAGKEGRHTRRRFLNRSLKLAAGASGALALGAVAADSALAGTNYVRANGARCRSCASTGCGVVTYYNCGNVINTGQYVGGGYANSCGVASYGWWPVLGSGGSVYCYLHMGLVQGAPPATCC